jgi:type VI secretion system protein ImpG
MDLDEKLYKAFLEEMHELENFRLAYAASHPTAALERDDPDVKRLLEALAYFAARTRTAGLSNIVATRRRLFAQFFPYLLSPLPAMGLAQAVPTGQFVEPLDLPTGSDIGVSAESRERALFRTLGPLRVLPISLGRVDTLDLGGGRTRLLLPFTTPYPRNEPVGRLSLHINHFNDFNASLRVWHALQDNLRAVSVIYNERATEESFGPACEVSFGRPAGVEDEDLGHPLQRERLYFHYPQAELFLNVELTPPPRNWRSFTLCLDLDAGWPRNLRLNSGVFQLFVVPIANLQRALAQPQVYDGTKERVAIRHPKVHEKFSLHSVAGVFQIDDGVTTPLTAGTLAGGNGSYEVEERTDQQGRKSAWVAPHLPAAFEQPRTLSVDALWIQAWFSELASQRLDLAPYRRQVMGLEWTLVGDLMPHHEHGFADATDEFLHLFVLQNKKLFNRDDLVTLLKTMGSPWRGYFRPVKDLLSDLRVEEVPDQRGGGTPKLVYHLTLAEHDPGQQPLLQSFTAHLQRILDSWISGARVEVRLEGGG